MEKNPVFAVVGGDRRQFFAAEFLRAAGYTVYMFAMAQGLPYETMKRQPADVYILPLPVSRDGENLNAPDIDVVIPMARVLEDIPSDALGFCRSYG